MPSRFPLLNHILCSSCTRHANLRHTSPFLEHRLGCGRSLAWLLLEGVFIHFRGSRGGGGMAGATFHPVLSPAFSALSLVPGSVVRKGCLWSRALWSERVVFGPGLCGQKGLSLVPGSVVRKGCLWSRNLWSERACARDVICASLCLVVVHCREAVVGLGMAGQVMQACFRWWLATHIFVLGKK